MKNYRAYFFDPGGHIYHFKLLECASDEQARKEVAKIPDDCLIEVWEGARKIARFEAGRHRSQMRRDS